MAAYIYKARDRSGQVVEGSIELSSKRAVVDQLAKQGCFPITITQQKKKFFGKKVWVKIKRVNNTEVILFSRRMAAMFRAGLNPNRCLNILVQQTHNKGLKKILRDLQVEINAGSSFADALSGHPEMFSKIYVNTVSIGEEGGNLEEVLQRLASFAQKQKNLKESIRSALLYPIIVLLVAVGVIVFLLSFVLPEFATVFERVNVSLPPVTQWMFRMSELVKTQWPIIMTIIIMSIFGMFAFIQTIPGRYFFDRFKLMLPIVGGLVRKVAILRLSRSLELLIRNGINIVRSFEIVSRSVGNVIIGKVLENVCINLRKGGNISTSLQESGEFPPMVVEMIAVGEETGDMEEMLIEISDSYEQEVEYSTKNLTSIIEPVLLVFMAAIVAFVAISMFLPMFDMIGVLEG